MNMAQSLTWNVKQFTVTKAVYVNVDIIDSSGPHPESHSIVT